MGHEDDAEELARERDSALGELAAISRILGAPEGHVLGDLPARVKAALTEAERGWDAETVRRQVADFNALADATRTYRERAESAEAQLAEMTRERDELLEQRRRMQVTVACPACEGGSCDVCQNGVLEVGEAWAWFQSRLAQAEARERQAFEAGFHAGAEFEFHSHGTDVELDVPAAFTRYLAQREAPTRTEGSADGE